MIAGALFDGNNLPEPKNPTFLRKIDPKTLAAMTLTSRQYGDSRQCFQTSQHWTVWNRLETLETRLDLAR